MASKMNNAHVITGVLSTKDFSEELYNQVKKKKLNVDILINNAGFGYSGKFLDSSMENYEEMINFKWKRELNERARQNNFRLSC